ncbi:MAG: bifunctional 23S rRNA (guanine(2069)-N(7))-methyltransferase RlmK/23S rRNA (guanine(2445)-N(2))-methyltransferase RlmL [bacterium]
MTLKLYATVPLGMAKLLREELRELGAGRVRATSAGVAFEGTLELAYRSCLWSRMASRVVLELARFPAPDADALYVGVRGVKWQDHLGPDSTLAVRATGRNAALRHTVFASRRVKDAVVDQFRDETGRRPSVDLRRPDLSIHLHLEGNWATLSIDLAGESLNRRGYRAPGMEAPLKESLAAAVLSLLGWPAVAAGGGGFVDPMCGGGTLPIEAALWAADRAPGLGREYFGFQGWRGHDEALWQRLLSEARERRDAGLDRLPTIVGYDASAASVRRAIESVERAGLTGRVHIERRELSGCEPPPRCDTGLLATNPPYGERLGEVGELRLLYSSLGALLRERFGGWRAGVLTGSEQLAGSLGLAPEETYRLYNGALECELLRVELPVLANRNVSAPVTHKPGPGSDAFVGRLRKRARHLAKWARRQSISCYRVYDADLTDYSAAIDRYEDFVHVQEYAPPASVDPAKAAERLADLKALVPEVLEVPPEWVFLKVRMRQRGRAQYVKLGQGGDYHRVREGGHSFLVNFTDYLDTGLFLDHRLVRQLVGEHARGRRVLNLFGYTGTASVYAAKGGARSTTTVDLSNTYVGWARRNFALNKLDERRNELVRADCLAWLAEQRDRWDLIFLDPPTFSNSKSLDRSFDVQQDHAELIQSAMARLAPDGLLIFSNNYKKFKLDQSLLSGLQIEDYTRQTIPEDFSRSRRIHHCFLIRA